MFLERQVPADSPQMAPVYENFAANLRDMVSLARHSGAQVLLSTVATNLKDCPPFASMHRANLRNDELHAWDALVQRGKDLETTGSYGDALKAYRSAADIDPEYAELQFRMARCLWAAGDFAGARERLVRAQDLDTLRFRADSRMNQVIRSVAASGSGIQLLDAAAIFSQESEHNVPGSDLFYEHVHMNPRGNFTLARAMLEQVSSMMPIEQQRTPVSSHAISQEACDRLLAFTPYDRARVASLVLRKMEHPPFTNQSNYAEQVRTLQKAVDGSSQDFWETVAQYRWAIAQNPQDRLLHLNYGFFLHDSEPAAAQQEFRSALPYDHAPVLCNWRKFN
jgi:tetratricopeptide (TPR) repeat protein